MKPFRLPALFSGTRAFLALACLVGLGFLVTGSAAENSKVRIVIEDQPAKAKPTLPSEASKAPSATAAAKQPVTRPADPKAKAAASTAAGDQPAKPATIDGIEIARGERGFLGIDLDANGGFKLSFYDKDKKPIAPDVALVALRWPVNYQKLDERTTLTPSADGKSMVSEKIVRAPHSFKLYMTLLKDPAPGGDPSPETYVVDFRK